MTNYWGLVCFSHNTEIYPSTSTSCPLIANSTGIAKFLPTDNSVKMFPNPFSQFATISFNNPNNENCSLTLYDIRGQQVWTKNNITTNNVVVEKNNLTSGLYFFVLRTTDRVIVTSKLAIE